jgi:hypothetical protein
MRTARQRYPRAGKAPPDGLSELAVIVIAA